MEKFLIVDSGPQMYLIGKEDPLSETTNKSLLFVIIGQIYVELLKGS